MSEDEHVETTPLEGHSQANPTMVTELRKRAVEDFLKRCLAYAEETIGRKSESGDEPEVLAKWVAYRDYTLYALEEVEKGELDHWFLDWIEVKLE